MLSSGMQWRQGGKGEGEPMLQYSRHLQSPPKMQNKFEDNDDSGYEGHWRAEKTALSVTSLNQVTLLAKEGWVLVNKIL